MTRIPGTVSRYPEPRVKSRERQYLLHLGFWVRVYLSAHSCGQVLTELEGAALAAGQGQENAFWGVGGLFGKARPAAPQPPAPAPQFGTVKN